MSLYIPPPPRRRMSIWPAFALGLGIFFLGGAVAFGIGMWTTQDERTSIRELTAQMRQPDVTRGAGIDTMVLAPAMNDMAQASEAREDTAVPGISIHEEIALAANQIARGDARAEVIRGPDNRPVLRLDVSGGADELDDLIARLPIAVEEGVIKLPPGIALPGGGLDVQTLAYHLVHERLRAGDGRSRDTAERLRREAIASLGPGTIATPDGHLHTLEEGDTLALIALVFYGDLNAHSRLVDANPNTLSGGQPLVAGQRLRIPGT